MPNAVSESAFQLVVVGSSAGGIEALSKLAATLPSPFPAPIVIAQHLDPNRTSHLGEILERHSTLPVITAKDNEPLHPNTIYVVPANAHVEIRDHTINLMPDVGGRPVPSVDLLLTSAAKAYGERLVAVILTGTGSDGTAGAWAVKQAGGTVVIQDPTTAEYPGMPQSLAPQVVDVVADIERIGPILHDILTGAGLPEKRQDGEREIWHFLDHVREQTGLDFRSYKPATIQRRLQRRIVATKSDDLTGYMRYLESHHDEYQRLASSFLISVTEFMRDPELFDVLRDQVLPELITYSRQQGRELRIWSAGCATGEEAYSLAILVCEALEEDLPNFNVRIFATDLDADAIEFARRGRYPADAMDEIPGDIVDRYFTKIDGHYEAKKQVRSMIVFGEHDLVQRAPFPRIDLVVCRNVLIYFTRELQQHTLELFAFALRDGGYLALGKTETVSPGAEYFTPRQGEQKIYRRQGERRPTPPPHLASFVPLPSPHTTQRLQRGTAQELLRTQQAAIQTRSSQENLLHQLLVGVVVVDRRYDIHEINSAARRLLSIHTQGVGEDLVHLAQHVPQRKLRAAIDQAIKESMTVVLKEVPVPQAVTGETIYIDISCYPQPNAEESDVPNGRALVLVTDVTEATLTRRALEEAHTKQVARDAELARAIVDLRSANAALTDRNDELTQARRQAEEAMARHAERMEHLSESNGELLAANEELTRAIAALRAHQEDFQTANEETQAAVEEVETLNEEMQASNEELETLNEELQATIEELNTSNSDLATRSDELQNLTVSLEVEKQHSESEKAQLAAILAGMGDAVLVVVPEGKPLLTNEAYAQLFGSKDGGDVIMVDEEGAMLPADATPQARAARGETFAMTFTLTDAGGNPHWCEAIGKPVREDGHFTLGVVIIRDITERSLRILQEEFAALAGHELRTPLTAIIGYLLLLTRSLQNRPDSERPLHNATVALSQARRLTSLINDLVDVSRLQTGKFRLHLAPVELDKLLQQTVEVAQVLAQDQTIVLTADNDNDNDNDDDGPIVINGDAERLQQMVLNLLTNAITHASGSTRVDVRLRRMGNMAQIEVQDYGKGIAAEHLSRLFSRFYQVIENTPFPGQGLGLGLFISQQIVAGHNGTISVSSTPGEGTIFTVQLPLLEQEEHRPTVTPA
jgi:two-component system CheB/CheR fusion protein